MATWRMRIACRISNATDTNTHSEWVTRIPFPRPQWLHERALTLRYKYIFCLVLILKQSNGCVCVFFNISANPDTQRFSGTRTDKHRQASHIGFRLASPLLTDFLN
jgi:hypothetical protein